VRSPYPPALAPRTAAPRNQARPRTARADGRPPRQPRDPARQHEAPGAAEAAGAGRAPCGPGGGAAAALPPAAASAASPADRRPAFCCCRPPPPPPRPPRSAAPTPRCPACPPGAAACSAAPGAAAAAAAGRASAGTRSPPRSRRRRSSPRSRPPPGPAAPAQRRRAPAPWPTRRCRPRRRARRSPAARACAPRAPPPAAASAAPRGCSWRRSGSATRAPSSWAPRRWRCSCSGERAPRRLLAGPALRRRQPSHRSHKRRPSRPSRPPPAPRRRLTFRVAAVFVGVSEGLAEWGMLAGAAGAVLLGALYVRRYYAVDPDAVYRLAMLKLNTNPGVLEARPLCLTRLAAWPALLMSVCVRACSRPAVSGCAAPEAADAARAAAAAAAGDGRAAAGQRAARQRAERRQPAHQGAAAQAAHAACPDALPPGGAAAQGWAAGARSRAPGAGLRCAALRCAALRCAALRCRRLLCAPVPALASAPPSTHAHTPTRTRAPPSHAAASRAAGLVSLEAKRKGGQYQFKLLAVDVSAPGARAEERFYLAGGAAGYARGNVLGELREPFLKVGGGGRGCAGAGRAGLGRRVGRVLAGCWRGAGRAAQAVPRGRGAEGQGLGGMGRRPAGRPVGWVPLPLTGCAGRVLPGPRVASCGVPAD
jgi:hypothetical protein